MGKDIVNTGIEGLDSLLGGGVPRGATVLITGPPGAGKTVMTLEYAFRQAKKGDRVLFVSTGEPIYKINKFASGLSFYDFDLISAGYNVDFGAKEKRGYVEFQDYSFGQITDEQYVGDFFDGLQQKVGRRSTDHLIIDSITSINMLLGDEIERRKKTLLFSSWVSRIGCTTILTAETGTGISSTERFLADVVIDLTHEAMKQRPGWGSGESTRCRNIEVMKLRGKRPATGKYIYSISGDGVSILSPCERRAGPEEKQVSTGIPDLDRVLGGIFRGAHLHFNTDGVVCFESLIRSMITGAIADGDGVIYLRSPSAGIIAEAADSTDKKRKVVIAGDLKPENASKLPVIKMERDRPRKLVDDIVSKVGVKGADWRAFIDLNMLAGEYGEDTSKELLRDLSDEIRSSGSILVTYQVSDTRKNDWIAGSDPGEIIDVWELNGYSMLQVTRSAGANSYEPHVLKQENGTPRLIQL